VEWAHDLAYCPRFLFGRLRLRWVYRFFKIRFENSEEVDGSENLEVAASMRNRRLVPANC
jgi:hypothetical protein